MMKEKGRNWIRGREMRNRGKGSGFVGGWFDEGRGRRGREER